jgi:ubiquinone/menaquinone biosynthesis C-methylase UbiE
MTKKYIPALGLDWLTPLYDPVMKWVMRESRFKTPLIKQARIKSGYQVLDLGCGTGTLTILIKQMHPGAKVVGLDADDKALDIARKKALRAGVRITFIRGMADQLPFPDESIDRVVSCLVLHHLDTENKRRSFREVFRVLRPSGELHVADFGRPHNTIARLISFAQRSAEMSVNVKGLLPEMFSGAGFRQVEESSRYMTVAGTLSLYRALKP